MPNPPSAARALYPHLPSAARPERAQTGPRLAEALWPRPKPQRRISVTNAWARDEENPWRDLMLQAAGFRRIR
jgi:hypothetical protein